MKRLFALLSAALILVTPIAYGAASSTPESDLQAQIDAKNKELEAVSQQIQQTQGTLNETTAKGKTLKQEVDKIDNSIKSVTLGIQQSTILLDTYGLQIESLSQQISDNEKSLDEKKDQIAGIFQNLQAGDNDSLLLSFLNNQSLTDTFLEYQALTDLNSQLVSELSDIRTLETKLADQQNQVTQKKSSTEAEKATLQAKKSIAEDQKAQRAQLLAQTKDQEKLYQQQLTELENKQQAISDEIDKIESDLRATTNPSEIPGKRPGVFSYPVTEPHITQGYGATAFAQKAYKTAFHNGLDMGAPIGTPIYAAADGTVTLAGNNGKLQYGKFVLIKHANNLTTIYGHMSRQVAVTGQVVKKGQLIGYVGNTGYATGPHVHFGVYTTASVKLTNIPGAGIVPVGLTLNPADYL